VGKGVDRKTGFNRLPSDPFKYGERKKAAVKGERWPRSLPRCQTVFGTLLPHIEAVASGTVVSTRLPDPHGVSRDVGAIVAKVTNTCKVSR
jgi:hypothetical protein